MHSFEIRHCFWGRDERSRFCPTSPYGLSAAKFSAHFVFLPFQFFFPAADFLSRCFRWQCAIRSKIRFRSEYPIVKQSQFFLFLLRPSQSQFPPLRRFPHCNRAGAVHCFYHGIGQGSKGIRGQITGTVHFAPVPDQNSLYCKNIVRIFPNDFSDLLHMFFHQTDTARLFLQSFSLKIIGKPQDHSFSFLPKKCQNPSNPFQRRFWNRLVPECSDINSEKDKFFLFTGDVERFPGLRRVESI